MIGREKPLGLYYPSERIKAKSDSGPPPLNFFSFVIPVLASESKSGTTKLDNEF